MLIAISSNVKSIESCFRLIGKLKISPAAAQRRNGYLLCLLAVILRGATDIYLCLLAVILRCAAAPLREKSLPPT